MSEIYSCPWGSLQEAKKVRDVLILHLGNLLRDLRCQSPQ
jgi:hypothetical protein